MRVASERNLRRTSQMGVSLIEVLVAVLVLSIGFLGMAGLQVRALSSNNSAAARSMATIDSYSVLEAMRADLANARAGSYNQTVQADACPSDRSSLAAAQLAQWCAQLGADFGRFASTTGVVECDASGSGYCTVTIRFDDTRAGAAGSAARSFQTRVVL